MTSVNNMKRKSRRRLGARAYKNYSEDKLHLAVELVKSKKTTSYNAEKRFGIPRRTIENRLNNIHSSKPGPRFRLSHEEESNIIKVLNASADFGYPLSLLDLKFTVWDYLINNDKTHIFNDKLPGDWWVSNFVNRYKDQLTLRSTQKLTEVRPVKTLEELKEYFTNLQCKLERVPLSNVMTYYETNVSKELGSTKFVSRRSMKYPERITDQCKGCASLMLSATADGRLLPPYVVYKSETLRSQWCRNGPKDTLYNISKSGWFDSECYLDWFKNVVVPWARKLDGWKLLIGDHFSSRLSLDVVELCEVHQIRIAFLTPGLTQLTQPLHVAFFSLLKKSWKILLLQYKSDYPDQQNLNKRHFPLLLKQLMKVVNLKKENIESGFKETGIHPFSPYQVFKKLPEWHKNCDQTLLGSLKENKHSTICRNFNKLDLSYTKFINSGSNSSSEYGDQDDESIISEEWLDEEFLDEIYNEQKSGYRATEENYDVINEDRDINDTDINLNDEIIIIEIDDENGDNLVSEQEIENENEHNLKINQIQNP